MAADHADSHSPNFKVLIVMTCLYSISTETFAFTSCFGVMKHNQFMKD